MAKLQHLEASNNIKKAQDLYNQAQKEKQQANEDIKKEDVILVKAEEKEQMGENIDNKIKKLEFKDEK